MSNTIITPSIIAKEALFQLRNNMVMSDRVYREYQKEYHKIGDTVNVRKPVKFVAQDGATRVNQDVTETTVPIVVNKQKHVSWNFSMKDLTLTIEEYSKRYIEPAGIALANQLDADLATAYKDFYLNTGTAGTTPSSFSALGSVAQKMSEFAIPVDGRQLVLNPAAHWSMADALKGIYNPSMSEELVRRGNLGTIGGLSIYEDQNIVRHTPGTFNAAYTVNGATEGANGTVTLAAGTGTFVVGDLVTFAGCNAVNPVNKQDLGYLMPFVVTVAKVSGAGALSISPSIVTTGAYQNVTGYPTNGGACLGAAAHTANMAFQKNAIGLVVVPLELPDGASWKAQETHEGISVAVIKDFDMTNYVDVIRLDILYGFKTIYPDLGVRLLG